MKKTIKFLIKEIIPITIGILIALFINNWNERQKDKEYINKILISMNEELMATSKTIAESLPHQRILIDTLNSLLSDEKETLFQAVIQGNGIHIPSIKINSWKAISNSKIELLEYDLMSAMTNIEESKDLLLLQTENISNYLYRNAEETGRYKKLVFKIMLMDILRNTIEIEKEIQNVIELI